MTPAPSTPSASAPPSLTEDDQPSHYGESMGQDSSVAGAYLNQFKEIVELIERLPGAPELIGDLLNWRPTSYNDYFAAQAMSGLASSADVFDL
jgi:hypothetical protein